MASSRPSAFKGGGGFLNGVDGIIQGYEFTTERPGGSQSGRGKKSDFSPLFCVLSVLVDGAEAPVTTSLFVGSADDFEVEDDGKTLVPVEEGIELRRSAEFSLFMQSLVDAGFPEESLPEDRINYEAIIGTRARFIQQVNAEKTKRLGKRKAKTGKGEYDRTDTVVETVYSAPDAKGKKAAKTNGAAKSAPKTNAKPAAQADDAGDSDLDDVATETVIEVLGEQEKGNITKAKLGLQVLKKLKDHEQRQEIYKRIFDDAFLANAAGWNYDTSKQVLSI